MEEGGVVNGSINDEIVRVHKSEQCHLARQVFDLVMGMGGGNANNRVTMEKGKWGAQIHREAFV